MASYDHADFVEEAVASVLAQSVEDLELIVVDDGSSDGTPDLVAALDDDRLTLVRLPDNRAVHPRATALGLARGELVAFQNSDDVWAPTKLEAQLAALDDTTVSASFTGVSLVDAAGRPTTVSWLTGVFDTTPRSQEQWLRHFFDAGNALCISSAICRRRDLLAVGGFDESLVQLSDLDLWVRLAALGRFEVLDAPLTHMRVVDGRNASAPSDAVTNRGTLEWARVLGRYTRRPVQPWLDTAFPEVVEGRRSRPVRLARLARHGWRHGGAAQRLFGDRLLEHLLTRPAAREAVVADLGAGVIHEFLEQRGRIRVDVGG